MKMSKLICSKKRRIIICAELMLIIVIVAALIIRNETYSVNIYDAEDSMIKLAAGRYLVTVEYRETDENLFVWLSDESGLWKSGRIFTEPQLLPYTENTLTYELWVTGISENVKFNLNYMTDNTGIISSITIEQTRFVKICLLFLLFVLLSLTFIIFAIQDGIICVTMKKALPAICVAGIAIVASLPLFTPYLPVGFDSYFHITRIEGVKDALYSGQFPVRVEPTYLNGYGYAVSTFYGGLFFYGAALMRMVGFPLQTCYKMLIFFINLITATGSYFFFKAVFKEKKWGIAGSALFTLSAYKFCNTYYRGAIAESIAMALVPIVALCLWNIYSKPHDKKYQLLFIPLTLAFSCVIESHLIGTEIVGVTAAVVCLIFYKKTFCRETFTVLVKFVIATLFLNAFFLVPFIDSLCNLDISVNSWDNIRIAFQETGLRIKDLFVFEIPKFNTEKWYYQEYTITVGTSFLVGIIVTIVACFCGGMKKENRKEFLFWTIMGALFLFMVTIYFPWNVIVSFCYNKLGGIGLAISNMIINMQYSYRLLIVGVLFITGMTIKSLTILYDRFKPGAKAGMIVMVGIAVFQCVLLEASIIATECNSGEKVVAITEYTGDSTVIGNGEYIPLMDDGSWTYINALENHEAYLTDVQLTSYHKSGTNIEIGVVNNSDRTGNVELPLLYYLGYKAYDTITGRKIGLYPSNRKHLAFYVEPGSEMNVKVIYAGKRYWRVADVVSILTLAFMLSMYIAYFYKSRKKLRK